jgi:hypothetical protein
MDKCDVNRPAFGVRSGDIIFRWSVGAYHKCHRTVLAWFQYRENAEEYLLKCRKDHPNTMFDILQSLY